MKYMGSKRTMLQNGLGSLILKQAKKSSRIVDLFCGSGAVVEFAAKKTNLPILAFDLQKYSVILTKAIIKKNPPVTAAELEKKWLQRVKNIRSRSILWEKSNKLSLKIDMRIAKKYVEKCRRLCKKVLKIGPIWNAYGGHYFSPGQALTFDYMLRYLPNKEPERAICHAAIIITATRCIASPGHTAQPFQPTSTAKKYLIESWKRDPLNVCKTVLDELCSSSVNATGRVSVGNAIKEARKLKQTDLVIVDPPYSGVQYSRFYHVLETLALGRCGLVSGVGRYPPIKERPQSGFSSPGQSKKVLRKLFFNLSKSRATVIFTFPEGKCSNGLSGKIVQKEAKKYFFIKRKTVKGKFSTLGGNKDKRAPRQNSTELILLMKPTNKSVPFPAPRRSWGNKK